MIRFQTEIFTHKEFATGKVRVFDISSMREFARLNAASGDFSDILLNARIPLEKSEAEFIRENHGIEQKRLERLKNPWLSEPLIAISWEQTSEGQDVITVIDGNHRFVRKHDDGEKEILCYIFRRELWENFVLPDHVILNSGGLNAANL